MPDKPSAERPAKRRGRATKPSRKKDASKDYASLPQKPITLKSGVTLPPALKGGPNKTRREPAAKKKTKRMDEISPQTLEMARSAAAREGVSLNSWLETLIQRSRQTPPVDASDALHSLEQRLEKIERSLQRLEDQRGFWKRFWDRFMEPPPSGTRG